MLWGENERIQVSALSKCTMNVYCGPLSSNWRRKWQPTPVFLLGKYYGWRSLVGYSPWGCKESDMTEWLHCHFQVALEGIMLSAIIQRKTNTVWSHLYVKSGGKKTTPHRNRERHRLRTRGGKKRTDWWLPELGVREYGKWVKLARRYKLPVISSGDVMYSIARWF